MVGIMLASLCRKIKDKYPGAPGHFWHGVPGESDCLASLVPHRSSPPTVVYASSETAKRSMSPASVAGAMAVYSTREPPAEVVVAPKERPGRVFRARP
jgi:hypothetical protein